MTWRLSIENVAGIRCAEARLEPGVNAVRASNWQGKSSFLAGIETAFGTAAALTDGQSSGRVALSTPDHEVTVSLERTGGSVTRTGTPYLTDDYDRVRADLFAFLDEDNELRRAVRDGENLEALLTRPLDFENIDERIADLRAEREQVDAELERAEDAADRLPALQERVTSLESELEELRAERRRLDDGDDDGAAADDRAELGELRAERDRVETRIERLETTVERVRDRASDARAELDSLSVEPADDVAAELETVRESLRGVERDRELLQSVFEANKRVLDEGRADLLTEVSHEMLDDRIAALDAETDEYRERVEELEAERDAVRRDRRRKRDLEERIADLDSRLADHEESLSAARTRRRELEARIEELAADVETTTERVAELDSELKYTEAALEDAREDLADAQARADKRDVLAEEYESLGTELADLRNRKDAVKRRAREAFSDALDDLLDRFETGFETARLTSTFDVVVARDGRETPLDALSEGERELLGFVAALAGHEAFDVADRVPVMLLDGLGALASENIELLVDYLADRVEYVVLTAYPEYGGFVGNELSPADWQVVSHSGPDAEATS
ncbi:MAG: archaea-specific SMC-related protein [Haloplanus sp.]